MANAKTKRKTTKTPKELDGVYFLKIVLYMIIGAQWVWFTDPGLTKQIPIPLGLIIGSLFAMHDHFQIDRKIEFAILLIASLIGFWTQTGILITILN